MGPVKRIHGHTGVGSKLGDFAHIPFLLLTSVRAKLRAQENARWYFLVVSCWLLHGDILACTLRIHSTNEISNVSNRSAQRAGAVRELGTVRRRLSLVESQFVRWSIRVSDGDTWRMLESYVCGRGGHSAHRQRQ